ncbi:MAG: alkylhydroperoxidase-related (seleno)protein, partial [Pseudomonadota bacterium]
ANGKLLVNFASAVLGSDGAALDDARGKLIESLGNPGLVAASLVAADFSMVDRAANGIGIFVEPMVFAPSEDFRNQLGINQFLSAKNSLSRY